MINFDKLGYPGYIISKGNLNYHSSVGYFFRNNNNGFVECTHIFGGYSTPRQNNTMQNRALRHLIPFNLKDTGVVKPEEMRFLSSGFNTMLLETAVDVSEQQFLDSVESYIKDNKHGFLEEKQQSFVIFHESVTENFKQETLASNKDPKKGFAFKTEKGYVVMLPGVAEINVDNDTLQNYFANNNNETDVFYKNLIKNNKDPIYGSFFTEENLNLLSFLYENNNQEVKNFALKMSEYKVPLVSKNFVNALEKQKENRKKQIESETASIIKKIKLINKLQQHLSSYPETLTKLMTAHNEHSNLEVINRLFPKAEDRLFISQNLLDHIVSKNSSEKEVRENIEIFKKSLLEAKKIMESPDFSKQHFGSPHFKGYDVLSFTCKNFAASILQKAGVAEQVVQELIISSNLLGFGKSFPSYGEQNTGRCETFSIGGYHSFVKQNNHGQYTGRISESFNHGGKIYVVAPQELIIRDKHGNIIVNENQPEHTKKTVALSKDIISLKSLLMSIKIQTNDSQQNQAGEITNESLLDIKSALEACDDILLLTCYKYDENNQITNFLGDSKGEQLYEYVNKINNLLLPSLFTAIKHETNLSNKKKLVKAIKNLSSSLLSLSVAYHSREAMDMEPGAIVGLPDAKLIAPPSQLKISKENQRILDDLEKDLKQQEKSKQTQKAKPGFLKYAFGLFGNKKAGDSPMPSSSGFNPKSK